MSITVKQSVVQNAIDGTRRTQQLVHEAFERYAGDQTKVNDFLATRYRDADNKTPLEMAEGSEAGLRTALCLLRPRNGC